MPRKIALAGLFVTFVALLPTPAIATVRHSLFTANFSATKSTCFNEGSRIPGALIDVFNGLGSQCINQHHQLVQTPARAVDSSVTHAALTISRPIFRGTFRVTTKLVTVQQLRSPANPWEVGWVLWDYRDNNHFYGFILKPEGWEIEKEWCNPASSPCQAQQFLASGRLPSAAPGVPLTISVLQSAQSGIPTFTVSYATPASPPTTIATVSDVGSVSSPYLSGRIGLYDEDARVAWNSVEVTAGSR
jgi:hypothetical protein